MRTASSGRPSMVADHPSLKFSETVRYDCSPGPTVTVRWTRPHSSSTTGRAAVEMVGSASVAVASRNTSRDGSKRSDEVASIWWRPGPSAIGSPQAVSSRGCASSRSWTVPESEVVTTWSSMVTSGPSPQARVNDAPGSSVGRLRSSSAGKRTSAMPTARVALDKGSTEVGKEMVTSFVVSARNSPTPELSRTTSRSPDGLSRRNSLGRSVGAPVARRRTSSSVLGSSHRRVTVGTGLEGSEIQEVPGRPSIRRRGEKLGSPPQVEVASTSSSPADPSESTRRMRPSPAVGAAAPVRRNTDASGRRTTRRMPSSSSWRVRSKGSARSRSSTMSGVREPSRVSGRSAGVTNGRCTSRPGMVTSLIPGPSRAFRPPCTSVMVRRMVCVSPGGIETPLAPALAERLLSRRPASVVTRIRETRPRPTRAAGISTPMVSTSIGSSRRNSTHWPWALPVRDGRHTLAGSPSKAAKGCASGRRARPRAYEEATISAAPRFRAVVWCSIPGTTRRSCGRRPVLGESSSGVSTYEAFVWTRPKLTSR